MTAKALPDAWVKRNRYEALLREECVEVCAAIFRSVQKELDATIRPIHIKDLAPRASADYGIFEALSLVTPLDLKWHEPAAPNPGIPPSVKPGPPMMEFGVCLGLPLDGEPSAAPRQLLTVELRLVVTQNFTCYVYAPALHKKSKLFRSAPLWLPLVLADEAWLKKAEIKRNGLERAANKKPKKKDKAVQKTAGLLQSQAKDLIDHLRRLPAEPSTLIQMIQDAISINDLEIQRDKKLTKDIKQCWTKEHRIGRAIVMALESTKNVDAYSKDLAEEINRAVACPTELIPGNDNPSSPEPHPAPLVTVIRPPLTTENAQSQSTERPSGLQARDLG